MMTAVLISQVRKLRCSEVKRQVGPESSSHIRASFLDLVSWLPPVSTCSQSSGEETSTCATRGKEQSSDQGPLEAQGPGLEAHT